MPEYQTNYRVLYGHYGGITKMIFLSNGNLASCSYDGSIKVWNPENGSLVFDLKGEKFLTSVISMAALSDGNLAAGYADGVIRVWNLKDGSVNKKLNIEPDSSKANPAIRSLTVLPGGWLAFSTCDNVIKIVDLNEEESNLKPLVIKSEGGSTDYLPLGVLQNGSLVSYHWHRGKDSTINVWNPANGELIRSVKIERSLADCFKVLSEDKIAVGSGHGIIKIVDLNSSEQTTLTKCHRDGVWSLEELPNGLLATGGSVQDATINVWNPKNGKLVTSVKTALIGYDEHISSLCISQDGKFVASAGSWSDSIKIWPSFVN